MVPESSIDTEVDDEVTRVEAVHYLQGASGHGFLSLLFLVVAVGLIHFDEWGASTVAIIIAFGVTLNGLSIYVWDRLRTFYVTKVASPDDDAAAQTRTLMPYRPSREMKAEMLASSTMVLAFVLGLFVIYLAIGILDTRDVAMLLIGGLCLGNLLALGWVYHRRDAG